MVTTTDVPLGTGRRIPALPSPKTILTPALAALSKDGLAGSSYTKVAQTG